MNAEKPSNIRDSSAGVSNRLRLAALAAAGTLILAALVFAGAARVAAGRADRAVRTAIESAERAYAEGKDLASVAALAEDASRTLAARSERLSPDRFADYSARSDMLRIVVGIYLAARSEILDEGRSARVAAAFAEHRLATLEDDADGLFDHLPLEAALVGLLAERLGAEADRVTRDASGPAEAVAAFEELRLVALERPRAFAEIRRRELEYLEAARAEADPAALAGLPEMIAVPAAKRLREARAEADESERIVIEAERTLERALSDIPNAIERLEEMLEAAQALGVAERVEALLAECRRIQMLVGETVSKARRGEAPARTILSTLEAAGASDRAAFREDWLDASAGSVSVRLEIDGYRVTVTRPADSEAIFIESRGYRFRLPARAPIRRAVFRASDAARRMQDAGIPKAFAEEWRLIEGPGFAVACLPAADGSEVERAFVGSELARAVKMDSDWRPRLSAYMEAARALVEAVRSDPGLEPEVRTLAVPVIESAIGRTDPRDYLRPAFCRRALEEGYIERYLPEVHARHADAIEAFRQASLALGRRTPLFWFETSGAVYTSFRAPESLEAEGDRLPDYAWTVLRPDGSREFLAEMNPLSPYSVRLAAEYAPCEQEPSSFSVHHQSGGRLSTHAAATGESSFDTDAWLASMRLDHSGDAKLLFPPHVCMLDPDDGVLAIVAPSGAVGRPVFAGIADEAERRSAIDAFISECAAVLRSPGELGLVQQHFFEYVLDSPMASRPDIIGNHAAYGDIHQTVYEFLGREVAGLALGDCDNVAEFFQRVTREQGRLSYILSLPSHAACAYAQEFPDDDEPWGLIVLQTGPVMLFQGETLEEAVERCFEHFSRGEDYGFSSASVPFLFRFAGEDTHTTYWLSSRIMVDEEYAELLIRVQGYWHYHYYATAIEVMEERLETDRYLSNFMELAGLYGTVGLHRESNEMTAAGIAGMHRHDDRVRLREKLDIARGHHRLGEDDLAEAMLSDIISFCTDLLRERRFAEFGRLGGARLGAAELYLAMDMPLEAFGAVRYDLRTMRNPNGRLIDRLLHALIKMTGDLDRLEGNDEAARLASGLRNYLTDEFASRVFFADDDFGDLMRNYSALSAFAEALVGFERVFERLVLPGPYPERGRVHHERGRSITEDDWRWIRIMPFSYWRLAAKMLDPEDERHDVERANTLINAMLAGAEAGREHGSMNRAEGLLHSAQIVLALLTGDIGLFSRVLEEIAAHGADRSIGIVADEFGRRSGLVPVDEFGRWAEVFFDKIGDRQHYFRVAHRALGARHYAHGLRMGRLAAERFPEERMMAVEAAYMAELAERLEAGDADKELASERLKAWRSAIERAEGGDAAAALEAVALAKELGPDRPALVRSLLARAEGLLAEGLTSDAVSAAELAVAAWRARSLGAAGVFSRLEEIREAVGLKGDADAAERLMRLMRLMRVLTGAEGGEQSSVGTPGEWRKSA